MSTTSAALPAGSSQEIYTDSEGCSHIRFSIPLGKKGGLTNMQSFESTLQSALQAVGKVGMGWALEAFDTQGEPLEVGKRMVWSKGLFLGTYHTLFGDVTVSRHSYQASDGGSIHVPMEDRACIIAQSTPRFAQKAARLISCGPARAASEALLEDDQIKLSPDTFSRIADEVARIVKIKQNHWAPEPSVDEDTVAYVGLGIDGTCVPICWENSWRQAMVATISLYNEKGERLDTVYTGAGPERGREAFLARVEKDIKRFKEWFPDAVWVGLTDGESSFREFLLRHCEQLMLDMWHALEYVAAAAPAMATGKKTEKEWKEEATSRLAEKRGAAKRLAAEMQARLDGAKRGTLGRVKREKLRAAIVYFTNNLDRMDYAAARALGIPVGSGVTEAACKTLIKSRFCQSGMKWLTKTIDQLICLRALHLSPRRWTYFWGQLGRFSS